MSIKGKTINSIETTIKDFENTLITWGEDKLTFGISTSITNTLNNNDTVKISGISTNLSKINGSYKIGNYIPGTKIPILNENILLKEKPDFLILFSWHIKNELKKNLRKKGFRGKFIIPLPNPKIES